MRANKIVCQFILGAFLAFNWSCVTFNGSAVKYQDSVQKDISGVDTTNVKTLIFGVVRKNGKRILFPETGPGRFDPSAQAVVGTALQQFVFAKHEIEVARGGKKDVITSVRTADGRHYQVLSSLDEGENLRVNAYAPISIPFSDIQQVSVLKPDRRGGAFVTIIAIVGGAAVGYVLVKGILSGFGNIFGKSIPDWE